MTEGVLVQLAAIVVLGIGAQWLAWKLRLPAILLLLLAGLGAGPGMELVGLPRVIDPDALFGHLLAPAASLAVAVILFEGGLTLRLSELGASGRVIRNLVSVGALASWLVAAVAARLIVGLPWPLAILLGALLVVTGPTVIGPLLRHVRPSGSVGPILLWEGIVIDPVGAILAVLVFEAILGGRGAGLDVLTAIGGGLVAAVVGSVVGLVGAVLMAVVLRRFWVPDYLHNSLALTAVVAACTASNLLKPESGLLAVTVMGLVLANQKSVSVRHIAEFKESLTVLLVSFLFVVLSARLTTEQLASAWPRGALFTLALILLARPASVGLATIGSGLPWRERLFLMCLAPRGIVVAAVASVFALELREAGVEGAEDLVPTAFTAIIGTVTVYGLASGRAARRLGLAGARRGYLIAGANPFALLVARALRDEGMPLLIVDTRTDHLAPLESAGLPTLRASILSPFVRERVDPGLIGRLLALTPNEEVNSLAALHFAGLFERENVYQLTPEPHGEARAAVEAAETTPEAAAGTEGADAPVAEVLTATLEATEPGESGRKVARELHGRILFGPGITHAHLASLVAAGAAVERLEVEEGDAVAAFRDRYGPESVPLFLVEESGDVVPVAVDLSTSMRTAPAVLGLVPPSTG